MPRQFDEEEIWEQYRYIDWYVDDLSYAKKRFFNVPKIKIKNDFAKNVIEVSDELRFTPPVLFDKYFAIFIEFVMTHHHNSDDSNEVASCFTTLLKEKLDTKIINQQSVITEALIAVEFIKENLSFFNNLPDIYGDLAPELQTVKQKLLNYQIKKSN